MCVRVQIRLKVTEMPKRSDMSVSDANWIIMQQLEDTAVDVQNLDKVLLAVDKLKTETTSCKIVSKTTLLDVIGKYAAAIRRMRKH